MEKEEQATTISAENIYRLNGRVPLGKAIPFGLQHVLAMFVANLAPVLIVCGAAVLRGGESRLSPAEVTRLLQCAMFAAGVGTCMQLYPIWKIGSKLPIVMGVSFTFLGSLLMIGTNPALGYEGMIGAVILGGVFEGLVGLSAKYWKRFLTPVVSACVVIAIGLSLLSVGMDSWGGGHGAADFGAWYHLSVGMFTLIVCLVSRYRLKGVYKNMNILVGLAAGYLAAVAFTVAGVAPMVDFSGITKTIGEVGFFSLPRLVFFTGHMPVFDIGAFFTIAIVYLVSAAETTGATTAVCRGVLNRDIKIEELQGSLGVDGFSSAVSGCFGCLPLTSFSQNVGLVTMTKVINRFTILMGALILILASLFPPLGAFFNSLPQAVLGGCTVMMFGSIIYEGIKMLKDCEFNDRTMIIVSISFCIGIGLMQTSGNFLAAFPKVVGDIFNGNAVAGVFVTSMFLSLLLPQETETGQTLEGHSLLS
ncbi:MAG: solute carrier family 23 protein [bacterium]|nr:solute carrier family 23 protein [bacterium]